MRLVLCLALIGCYERRSLECEIACDFAMHGASAPCPSGLSCGDDSLCYADTVCSSRPDGSSMPIDARACFGTNEPPFIEICPMIAPRASETLPTTIMTGSGGAIADCSYVIPQVTEPSLCVIYAQEIVIDQSTRVIGARALVLIGQDKLHVASTGVLDLAGKSGSLIPPAGGNFQGCGNQGGNDGGTQGGGGAPGGTFRGRGGMGGGSDGALAQVSMPVGEPPAAIRGGCRGGDGGASSTVIGGIGGSSGGAVYLLSPKLVIDGTINASGAGARLAALLTGGGGGGSGGMILLWSSQMIEIGPGAEVFALGGGGGTGGPATAPPGVAGDDPGSPSDPAMQVTRGAGVGTGGAGGARLSPAGGNGGIGTGNGGGGGGGGVGAIKIRPSIDPIPVSSFAPLPD